ncbi:cation:proton antiporter [Nonomuraea antimicrobica]
MVAAGIVVVGLTVALLVRRLLTAPRVLAGCARAPRSVGVVIAGCALGAAAAAESWGLTAVFGAFVVGLAIPTGPEGARWGLPAGMVSRVGGWLMPVFLVQTGLTMWTASASVPLPVVLVTAVAATVLAVLAKIGGGYVLARRGGEPRVTAVRLGVLLNTRGLTEIAVLQAGYSLGVLTPVLYLALVVMALTTTAMTGPLLSLIDRPGRVPVPALRVSASERSASW